MQQGHGVYMELSNEKDFLDITTKTKKVFCHFFHPDFTRCKIVDHHIEILVPKHMGTRFVKMAVEKAPFLVEKLQIKVLPCLIGFVDGVMVDRIVGFEEFGNKDDFKTQVFELRLAKNKVITNKPQGSEDKDDD